MPLPFSAFLGYDVARRALLCTLVDPTLRGVVISGGVGTGKSALLRSFARFVRDYVDPEIPFVDVPLGVGDDRLIGGIDLDVALGSGNRRISRGLLAEADGGFLVVDDLPLLEGRSAVTIAQALESEQNVCEREGVSFCAPARFVLLATTVPSEREISVGIADRVAFLVAAQRRLDERSTGRLLMRMQGAGRLGDDAFRHYDQIETSLGETVISARILYPIVWLGDAELNEIVETAESMYIEGNRAEVFAAKAARAHAALRGARRVASEDVEFAVATVLAPRARNIADATQPDPRRSDDPQGNEPQQSDDDLEPPQTEDISEPDREPSWSAGMSGGNPFSGERERDVHPVPEDSGEGGSGTDDDFRNLDAVDFDAPLEPLEQFFLSRTGSVAGGRGSFDQWQRGRHTRSVSADPRGRSISVGATLRAASPHQKRRRAAGSTRVVVRAEDIRVKKFTEQAGTLFIFCVDASGSMAANRMREAKGAVGSLLQQAYINRDSVALIAFQGAEAELLLPPTGSVERFKRSLDVLPTGGGTPLASALLKAYAIYERARRSGVEQILVVLLTDGRANVPMNENAAGMIMQIRLDHVRGELERIAEVYRRQGTPTLVIDTKQVSGHATEAARLAALLGGRYYYLPHVDAQEIVDVVRRAEGGGMRDEG